MTMIDSELEEIVKNGKFSIFNDTYSILKTTRTMENSLACMVVKSEITVIATERAATHTLPNKDILEADHGWRVISFEMELPLELIGFLAKISSALAEKNISIFVVSTFSNDLILVKENNLQKTIEALNALGFNQV
jgi:uncharacterized protein